jgi:hypothetical protein
MTGNSPSGLAVICSTSSGSIFGCTVLALAAPATRAGPGPIMARIKTLAKTTPLAMVEAERRAFATA